jgi:hypothetical protein
VEARTPFSAETPIFGPVLLVCGAFAAPKGSSSGSSQSLPDLFSQVVGRKRGL